MTLSLSKKFSLFLGLWLVLLFPLKGDAGFLRSCRRLLLMNTIPLEEAHYLRAKSEYQKAATPRDWDQLFKRMSTEEDYFEELLAFFDSQYPGYQFRSELVTLRGKVKIKKALRLRDRWLRRLSSVQVTTDGHYRIFISSQAPKSKEECVNWMWQLALSIHRLQFLEGYWRSYWTNPPVSPRQSPRPWFPSPAEWLEASSGRAALLIAETFFKRLPSYYADAMTTSLGESELKLYQLLSFLKTIEPDFQPLVEEDQATELSGLGKILSMIPILRAWVDPLKAHQLNRQDFKFAVENLAETRGFFDRLRSRIRPRIHINWYVNNVLRAFCLSAMLAVGSQTVETLAQADLRQASTAVVDLWKVGAPSAEEQASTAQSYEGILRRRVIERETELLRELGRLEGQALTPAEQNRANELQEELGRLMQKYGLLVAESSP